MITWYPTVSHLHHRYAKNKRCCCCGSRSAAAAAPTAAQTEWRCVESVCRGRWADGLHRFRWAVLALLLALVAGSSFIVADGISLATKEIQVLRASHPFTVYLDQVKQFPSSPHVNTDGMDVFMSKTAMLSRSAVLAVSLI